HQQRNIAAAQVVICGLLLFTLCVLFFSRLRWRIRLAWFGALMGTVALICALFQIRGVSGDLLPILTWRFRSTRHADQMSERARAGLSPALPPPVSDYPQFLGPNRNGVLRSPIFFSTNWTSPPPQQLWRRSMGAAWSGFAIAGSRAVTQEQRGE